MRAFRSETGSAGVNALAAAVATALVVAAVNVLAPSVLGRAVVDGVSDGIGAVTGEASVAAGGDAAVALAEGAVTVDDLLAAGAPLGASVMMVEDLARPGATGGTDDAREARIIAALQEVLPPEALGNALGTIAAGVPADQVLEALALQQVVPNLTARLVQAGLDEADAPDALYQPVTQSAVTAVNGLIAGEVDLEDVALAGLGGLADTVVDSALSGVPVLGDSGALGALLNSAIQGAEPEDLAVSAGTALAGSVLPAPAVPIIGAMLNGAAGRTPGPGSVIGPTVGMALGGPLGGFVGGFAGSLLDNVLGFGRIKKFDLTEDLDVTGDGRPDRITFYTSDVDYGYTVDSNLKDLPLRQVQFRLEEQEVHVDRNDDDRRLGRDDDEDEVRRGYIEDNDDVRYGNPRTGDRGRPDPGNETRYFIDVDYEWDQLFPSTDAPRTRIEGLRYDREDNRYTGYEITEEEYLRLRRELGGTEGSLSGRDPRTEALLDYVGDAGPVTFRQKDRDAGVHFRYDVDGDGNAETLRWFPSIEGYFEDDGRFELVGPGVPVP